MSTEKNTSNFRMILSNIIEKYDVFMLRRNPLVQKLWVSRINKKAKQESQEYLNNANSAGELIEYIQKNVPDHRIVQILDKTYDACERGKFEPLFDFVGEGIKGKSFLDIGPGHGHSMDLAREAGASSAAFIDIDPAFYAFNELKGHKGFLSNYCKGKGLDAISPNRYDFIMSRGALNADQFNRNEPGFVSISKLIQSLDNIWTGNGMILINPTFDRGTTPGKNYWCQDPEAFLKSQFCRELFANGYEKVVIDTFNHPQYHPYTFIKKAK